MQPLLIFPRPASAPREVGAPGFTPAPRTPDRKGQRQRLHDKVEALDQRFHNVRVQGLPDSYEPEKMLVLETAGSIANLTRALRAIPGLDVLVDIQADDMAPDDHFYMLDQQGNKSDSTVKSYLYLTMTNAAGLARLKAEWDRFDSDAEYKPARGMTPLLHLFEQLHDIRYWSAEDRIRNTGVLEDWRDRVTGQMEYLPAEVELWCSRDEARRGQKDLAVRGQLESLGGRVTASCVIPEISYHALLAEIPRQAVAGLLNNGDLNINLLQIEEISFFRPIGQSMAPDDEFVKVTQLVLPDDPPGHGVDVEADPIVALLDGLPLENHTWLEGRLRIDDPDDFSDAYTPAAQLHGTAMASLILHGDRNNEDQPLPNPLYVRPIMKPRVLSDGTFEEVIPEQILPIDLIHRAVKRIFEGDGNEPAVAPTIKVINLSIGDPAQLFDSQRISAWARLLDWLSAKYRVLFVVSAGNHARDLQLPVDLQTFNGMDEANQRELLIRTLYADMSNRRLYSPAEAVNVITVGGVHADGYQGPLHAALIDPIGSPDFPSPMNPLSWGHRRSIKPEVLMPAGRLVYRNMAHADRQPVILRPNVSVNHPPGQKVAAPTAQPGNLRGFGYTCGTSNAAALATREIARLSETLVDLYQSEFGQEIDQDHEIVLLKALLIHGAEVATAQPTFRNIFAEMNGNLIKALAARFFGYGPVNTVRIRGCSDHQATLLRTGALHPGNALLFELPLPDCLSSVPNHRRLIVTLAWLSPTNPHSSVDYRAIRLSYRPPTESLPEINPLAVRQRAYDDKMVLKGTALHEIITGEEANPYVEGSTMKIRIECTGDLSEGAPPVPFGMVVTLDSENTKLPIYSQVKQRVENVLRQQLKIETSKS